MLHITSNDAEVLYTGTCSKYSPNCTGQGQSDLAHFAVKLQEKPILHFFKYLFLEKVFKIFFYFIHKVKIWCFDLHLSIYHQSPAVTTPLPLLLGFAAAPDHPKAGELLTHCGLKSGAVTVKTPVPHHTEYTEGGGSSVGSALQLFLSGLMAQHSSGQIPETIELFYTPSTYWWR